MTDIKQAIAARSFSTGATPWTIGAVVATRFAWLANPPDGWRGVSTPEVWWSQEPDTRNGGLPAMWRRYLKLTPVGARRRRAAKQLRRLARAKRWRPAHIRQT